MSVIEHRWRDITGPAVADDPDWRTLRTRPTFGDGSSASLTLGELTRLAPRGSRLVVYAEMYDGQGEGAAPVTPTPEISVDLELITVERDGAGNDVYSVGPISAGAPNQRRQIEVELPKQGISWVRITNIAGATVTPGSIRIFAHEAVDP